MFIKWKYNDHGWLTDWNELEIPDGALNQYDSLDGSIRRYIINNCNTPVWGERYTSTKIVWQKVEKTHAEMQEIYKNKIDGLRVTIRSYQDQINKLKKMLD